MEALVLCALRESSEHYDRARFYAYQLEARQRVPAYLRPRPDDTLHRLREAGHEAAIQAEIEINRALTWVTGVADA